MLEKFNFLNKKEKSVSKYSPDELINFQRENIGIFTCDEYKFSQEKITRIEENGGLPFSISKDLQLVELHFDPRPGIEFTSKTVPESISLLKKILENKYEEESIVFIASWIADKFSRSGFNVSEIPKEIQIEFAASKGLELDGKYEQEFIERNIGTEDPEINKQLEEMIYRFDKYEESFSNKKPTIDDIKIAWIRLGDLANFQG
jgi:hypothetical protein